MSELPQRIQRKREKGFKLPPHTVCITRGTVYGNPFLVGKLFTIGRGNGKGGFSWLQCASEQYNDGSFIIVKDRAHAVEMYREYRKRYPLTKPSLDSLRKASFIACFCDPNDGLPCHGDVLLEILKETA